ncbi:diacylglycerol O-acyltransferase 2 isoform X1 [Pocillopora verrucosa]|uniref:diacylglycerol O-acyltransferase 2 isoform X1 n=1 Tax=Pocillopora verrucosa TaxID=203993 RepID=UPI003340D0DC
MSPSIDYILQYLSIALLYFVGFLGGTHVLGILTLYQIFFYTPLWPVVLLYLSWTYLVEWKTPERGGRDLFINFVRRLSVFKYMRDYYPITLVKTSDLDPQKNYIFGYHPHGAFTEGASIGLNTEACGFSDKFPGIIPHLSVTSGTLNQLEAPYYRSAILKALLYRDILMALGVIDVSRHSLEYNLTQKGAGHSVVIVVGGAAEIREMGFDSYALIIKRRKGFMKLALQTGSDLVPVFGFGQNNIYQVIGGSRSSQFSRFQRWLRSFTSCLGTCFLPKRSPINVVVGSPVPVTKIANPTQEEIDQLHAQYLEALTDLYEKNKDKYHPTGTSELLII